VVDIVNAAELIPMEMMSAALTISTTNSIQLLKLDQEVETFTKYLATLSYSATTHTTQFFHLQGAQLKLDLAFNHTQITLN
jgi:glycerol-3-phosphate O-acyltransferase